MFLQYMTEQEERNRERENTLIQMFQKNRNNENVAFNSDGRINELPDELEEDLQNAGVSQEQIEAVKQNRQEKNRIKSDRGLGTKDGNKGKGIRPGYEYNEYYLQSYNNALANRQRASKPTTRSDTAATGSAGTAGGMTELDELREAGARADTSLQQAFADIARSF
jgi:hypothetical protein